MSSIIFKRAVSHRSALVFLGFTKRPGRDSRSGRGVAMKSACRLNRRDFCGNYSGRSEPIWSFPVYFFHQGAQL